MFKFDYVYYQHFCLQFKYMYVENTTDSKYTQIGFDKIKVYGVNDHVSLSRKTEQVRKINLFTVVLYL